MRQRTARVLAMLAALTLHAEVVDSSPAGFTVKQSLTIKASPQEVYKRFFRVAEWWNSQHTFSGDAKNLTMDERAGGCFCEKLADGGGVKHLELASFTPGKSMIFHGGLGPMLSMAAAGTLMIQLTAVEGGTKLDWSYAVSGYLPAGMNTWAKPADGMLSEQFARLKAFAER